MGINNKYSREQRSIISKIRDLDNMIKNYRKKIKEYKERKIRLAEELANSINIKETGKIFRPRKKENVNEEV